MHERVPPFTPGELSVQDRDLALIAACSAAVSSRRSAFPTPNPLYDAAIYQLRTSISRRSLTEDRVGVVCQSSRRVEHEHVSARWPGCRTDRDRGVDVRSHGIGVGQVVPIGGFQVERLQRSELVSLGFAAVERRGKGGGGTARAHVAEFWRLGRVRVARWIS